MWVGSGYCQGMCEILPLLCGTLGSRVRRGILLCAALASVGTGQNVAGAGYAIDVKITKTSRGTETPMAALCVFNPNRAKISVGSDPRSSLDVVYEASNRMLVLIDHYAKEYWRFGLDAVERAESAVTIVERVVAEGLGGSSKATVARVVRTSELRQIGEIPCQRFLIVKGKTPVQEVWVTSWKHAGITRGETAILRECLEACKKAEVVAGGIGLIDSAVGIPVEGFLRINGFPIEVVQMKSGQVLFRMRLSLPTRLEEDVGGVVIPEGYVRNGLR